MNKLRPEHLHLLLDEPIYVLEEHFDANPQDEAAPIDQEQPTFKGKNSKGILIVNEGAKQIISGNDQAFLLKGLNALQITLDDIAIVATSDVYLSNPALKYTLRINFSKANKSQNLYAPSFVDDIKTMECDSLEEIQANLTLKKQFWLGLKSIFGQ